jgi:hypothetical protein
MALNSTSRIQVTVTPAVFSITFCVRVHNRVCIPVRLIRLQPRANLHDHNVNGVEGAAFPASTAYSRSANTSLLPSVGAPARGLGSLTALGPL